MKTHDISTITLNNGRTIPQLGFGTLNVQADRTSTPANIDRTAAIVGLALELGYRPHRHRAELRHRTGCRQGDRSVAEGRDVASISSPAFR